MQPAVNAGSWNHGKVILLEPSDGFWLDDHTFQKPTSKPVDVECSKFKAAGTRCEPRSTLSCMFVLLLDCSTRVAFALHR
jgi:hypothetical protein